MEKPSSGFTAMVNTYTVRPGDSLSQIASQYKVPVSSLTGYRSGNPDLIYPGEKINVGSSFSAPVSTTHPQVLMQSVKPNYTPVPKSSFTSSVNSIPKVSQPDWLSKQTQNIGSMAKKVTDTIVPQAYAAEKPPPRKVFNTDAHPDAVSTPGYVQGTPDWVKPIIQKAAEKHNIPTMLLSALLKQESGFNPNAGSSAGAQGIAQFMPATAKGMGVDPFDPESAIMGAAQYLRRSWDKFGKPELALAAYNAGGGAVNQYGGIPPYKETQNYVKNIMAMIGELHQSANGPYLETLNEIKKNKPDVLGSSTKQSPVLMQPLPSGVDSPIPAPVDIAISRIRKAKPNIRLTDQQIRELYDKYGERLLSEIP